MPQVGHFEVNELILLYSMIWISVRTMDAHMDTVFIHDKNFLKTKYQTEQDIIFNRRSMKVIHLTLQYFKTGNLYDFLILLNIDLNMMRSIFSTSYHFTFFRNLSMDFNVKHMSNLQFLYGQAQVFVCLFEQL